MCFLLSHTVGAVCRNGGWTVSVWVSLRRASGGKRCTQPECAGVWMCFEIYISSYAMMSCILAKTLCDCPLVLRLFSVSLSLSLFLWDMESDMFISTVWILTHLFVVECNIYFWKFKLDLVRDFPGDVEIVRKILMENDMDNGNGQSISQEYVPINSSRCFC